MDLDKFKEEFGEEFNNLQNKAEESNTDSNKIEEKDLQKNITTKKTKPKFSFFLFFLFLALLIGVFLYWFQADPKRKEQLETFTGMDLNQVDTLARTIGTKTNEILEKTPLSDVLATQKPSQRLEIPTESNPLQQEQEKVENTGDVLNTTDMQKPITETEEEAKTNTKLENTSPQDEKQENTAISQETIEEIQAIPVQENIQQATDIKPQAENIIQPPVNAPVLNLVTQANPEEKARIEEEERIQALNEIETLLNQTPVQTYSKPIIELDTDTQIENQTQQITSNEVTGTIVEVDNSTYTNYDKVISPVFIKDITKYLVGNYSLYDNKQRQIKAGPSQINHDYASQMRALPKNSNLAYAREYVLKYVYTPDMLNSLYSMYSDAFIDELIYNANLPQANAKAFSQEEQKQLLHDYATYLYVTSNTFKAITSSPKLESLFTSNKEANTRLEKEKELFAQTQVLYEQARYNKEENIDELKEDLLNISKEIEDSRLNLEEVRANILTNIRASNMTGLLSDKEVLYIFEWLGRRYEQNPQTSIEASNTASSLLVQLANKMNVRADIQ